MTSGRQVLNRKRVATQDFIRNYSAHSDAALAEPIILTKNGRDRLVLMSIEQYDTLRRASESVAKLPHLAK
jgi:prevent-host-death family protein